MSLKLSFSGDIECSVRSGIYGQGVLDEKIIVGDYEIDERDFAELVMYYLTNTDLRYNDPRISLKQRIDCLGVVEGYNGGNTRYGSVWD